MSEPTKAQRKAARRAVEREMRSRTYDRHAYDDDVFKEGVRDIADAALRAAFAVEGQGESERDELARLIHHLMVTGRVRTASEVADAILEAGFHKEGEE